jgi:hypothetical protein
VSQISSACSMSWHRCVNCIILALEPSSLCLNALTCFMYMPQNSTSRFWLHTLSPSLVLSLSETFLIFHNLS